jgi:hypothetical protein
MDFKFAGKEYVEKGPRVAKGTTISAKKIDKHNVELTYKLKDKITETDCYQLSASGKTLTNTVTFPGDPKNEIDVWDRQ